VLDDNTLEAVRLALDDTRLLDTFSELIELLTTSATDEERDVVVTDELFRLDEFAGCDWPELPPPPQAVRAKLNREMVSNLGLRVT
jgi:hypothetical protein